MDLRLETSLTGYRDHLQFVVICLLFHVLINTTEVFADTDFSKDTVDAYSLNSQIEVSKIESDERPLNNFSRVSTDITDCLKRELGDLSYNLYYNYFLNN